MAVPASTMLDFIYWCWRTDPDGKLSYPEAARMYNAERKAFTREMAAGKLG
jgi:hypothetical protein